MAAITLNSSTSTSSVFEPGWKKEQVTESAVQKLFVAKFKELVTVYEERKQVSSLKDLNVGPWYANDYAVALLAKKQEQRHTYLLGKSSFYYGFAPQGFSHTTHNASNPPKFPKEKDMASYTIERDCTPVQALKNIREGRFSFIDCGTAVEIAMYETLHTVFGDKLFNQTFASNGPHPLNVHPHLTKTSLYQSKLAKEAIVKDAALLQEGDNVYFANSPLYSVKFLDGLSLGLHTVWDKKCYIAFGTPSKGLTEDGVNDWLLAEFNTKPLPLETTLSATQIEYLKDDYREPRQQVEASIGGSLDNFIAPKEAFNAVIQAGQAGRQPIVRRLDVTNIQKTIR